MTVHRQDGMQQTTKLERIGKLAQEQKDTLFNNLWQAVDLTLLRKSYQELDGKKAVGTDGVTKAAYGAGLEDNLQDLLRRIRQGGYKPKPTRRVEIPKEDGSSRPLEIACLEDKLVQEVVATILTAVYEPLFLPCSYGYRAGVNGHAALKSLMKYSNQNRTGATVEIDLEQYFNSIPHAVLLDILGKKIKDKYFLKLIGTLLRTPLMEENKVILNKRGSPQGSIVSPILSNIYLHYVVDEWFYEIRRTHLKGRAELIRFADDMVWVFEHQAEAKRFYEVLPKRLEKYGLKLHTGKSRLINSGSRWAEEAHARGERLVTYKFLGFVCYWGQSRNGSWRLKYKSRSDRITSKLKGLRKYLKGNLGTETQVVIRQVKRIVRGWINYHAISDNQRAVGSFILRSKRILIKWLNRKGGQRKLNWEKFSNMLERLDYPKSFKTTSMFATS